MNVCWNVDDNHPLIIVIVFPLPCVYVTGFWSLDSHIILVCISKNCHLAKEPY
uniref:Uncharacterized protein n=1 Tax=Lepeophtheirus salmonis TaxID=72036 RepID=A0A0K2TJ29_LEPSM